MDKQGYKLDLHSYCTHYERAEEEYGSWSESWNNDFREIRLVGKGEYSDISSDLRIKPGKEVWVVWLEWSHGDSFGWSDRGSTAGIAVFTNYEDAEKLQKELESRTEYEFGPMDELHLRNRILFETSHGEVLDIYTGTWCGYFERLDSVHIEHTWMHGARIT